MDAFDDRLRENLRARTDVPVWQLCCLECYSIWQFGAVFFSGRSFSLFGRTPLPLDMESTAMAVLLGGLVSALLMICFQRRAALLIRVGAPAAALCSLALFFPLPGRLLAAAVYAQLFICLALFGCCHALAVLLFSEEAALRQAVITTALAAPCVALLQNELLPVPFEIFNAATLLLLALFSAAAFRLPVYIPAAFTVRADRPRAPLRLVGGLMFWVLAATFVMETALTLAESVPGGVTTAYAASLPGALAFLYLWKGRHLSPWRLPPLFMGLLCAGVALFMAGARTAGCALMGLGFMAFSLVACMGQRVFCRYPSRWLMPGFMGMILLAVAAHAALIEALRPRPGALYAVCGAASVVLLLAYLLLEPYLDYSREPPVEPDSPEKPPHPFDALTPREREVAELLLQGYTGGGIARQLFISENTVATHRRELYRKLDIHSKRELFALAAQEHGT